MNDIKEHMEVIGADGVHVGTVDKVEGNRIKLTKKDSGEGSHKGHHHYIDRGLVAGECREAEAKPLSWRPPRFSWLRLLLLTNRETSLFVEPGRFSGNELDFPPESLPVRSSNRLGSNSIMFIGLAASPIVKRPERMIRKTLSLLVK